MLSNAQLEQRLEALKTSGRIGGWSAPHQNYGNGNPMLPWTVMPIYEGASATNYYNEADLLVAIQALERFGPTHLVQPSYNR